MTDSSSSNSDEEEGDDEDESALEPSDAEPVEGDEVVEGELADDRRLSRPAAFAGPLPPPNTLDEYEQVVPGLKHDIVNQWKAETSHRHHTIDGMRKTDHEAMQAYYDGEKRGQYLGFAILVGVLTIAALSIVMDQPIVGIASLVAAGGSAVWALRRSSPADTPPARDLGQGDDVEGLPPSPDSDGEDARDEGGGR